MAFNSEEILNSILKNLDRIKYIASDDIPNIDLYMDQVTTFMDSKLRASARYRDDKILTKTMINNYAKNDLLPPPVKKKYSREHVLLLIFIYYFKNVLSINDIQTLLQPLSDDFFGKAEEGSLKDIYDAVISMEKGLLESLKADVVEKYRIAEKVFENAPVKDEEFLRKFAFICLLSSEVYLKKMIIENLVDDLAGNAKAEEKGKNPPSEKKKDKQSE